MASDVPPVPISELQKLARDLPRTPGVYLFKDRKGTVLYIGKAKNLRSRVGTYFQEGGLKGRDVKTHLLVSRVADVEVIATATEYEALLLEDTLIKDRAPRYNINLKDGKSYPVIRLTNERFPKVFRTRTIVLDGSEYFGPFPKVNQIDVYLELIDKLFPLRKRGDEFKRRDQPCLNYHIGRCAAPCVGLIEDVDYQARVAAVRKLLGGKKDELIAELRRQMLGAAGAMRFEKAAELRDQVAAITEVRSDQNVVDFSSESRDYVGVHEDEERRSLAIFQIRHGQLLGKERFTVTEPGTRDEVLTSFLLRYYSGVKTRPRRLFVQLAQDAAEMLQLALDELLAGELGARSVEIRTPLRGKHAEFLRMVERNAELDWEAAQRRGGEREDKDLALEELRAALGIDAAPRRIEGFDVSHLSGTDTVASLVVFLDGSPAKSEYRTFKLRTLNGKVDDFESIREVVARRYSRLVNDNLELPDLVLVDGGKGQVSAAVRILRALGLTELAVVGLAKRHEEVFVPGRSQPILLPQSSRALRVLQAVRDETHRFATGFNQRLRSKRVSLSVLEDVHGIGRARSRRLLESFGSIAAIQAASPEAVASRGGLTPELAGVLLAHLGQLRDTQLAAEDPVPIPN
jgi:excinuclease ABC subunit C